MHEERVEIRVVGELEVLRDGRPVALPASRKTRALLGLLATTSRPQLREHICELLWPRPDDPRAALRWSLTKLRGVLGPTAAARQIIADRDHVGLRTTRDDCDLTALRDEVGGPDGVARASTETLNLAASRFRGELLHGDDLPSCFAFSEWLQAEREAVRRLRVSILGALVERLAASPNTRERALAHARARVTADPLSEAAHIDVIRVLTDLGRRREAQRQFETCCHILESELGAAPSAALRAARATGAPRTAELGRAEAGSIRSAAESVELVSDQRSAPPPPPPLSPMIGRRDELAALAALMTEAREGRGPAALVVTGEPGVGKTRLLEEIEALARSAAATVLRGRAFEAEASRAYGPWVDLLREAGARSLGDGDRHAALAPLLPERTLGASYDDRGDRVRLFDAVVGFLGELSRDASPLVFLLDDLHWLDDASASLLHYVLRASQLTHVLVVCAARGEELFDNPASLQIVRALARAPRAKRIDLGPLDDADVALLASAADPGVDVARVVAEAAGNPLFALEVTRALARGQELERSLERIIDDRLARLDEAAREVLPWAAALGARFDAGVLARATGLDAGRLLSSIATLERRGILRAVSAREYDFLHDLVRAAAYRRLAGPRRRLTHAHIARAMSAVPDPGGHLASEVARHASMGGEDELAARACLAAAERCVRLFAADRASELVDTGIRHAAALAREVRLPLQSALVRVRVLSGAARGREDPTAREILQLTVEASDAGLPTEVASGFQTLSILQHDAGDFSGAHTNTLRAAAAAGSRSVDSTARAHQQVDTARCLAMIERDMDRARSLVEEAGVVLADRAFETLGFQWAAGLVACWIGDEQKGRDALDRALVIAIRTEDRWAECECRIRLVKLDLEVGRARAAAEGAAGLLPVAQRMPEGSESTVARALWALALRSCGDADGHAVDEAIESLRRIDAKGMLAYVLACAAQQDADAGLANRATSRAREAIALAESVERRNVVALARVLLARLALARGDRADARRELDQVRPDIAVSMRVSAGARRAFEAVDASVGAH